MAASVFGYQDYFDSQQQKDETLRSLDASIASGEQGRSMTSMANGQGGFGNQQLQELRRQRQQIANMPVRPGGTGGGSAAQNGSSHNCPGLSPEAAAQIARQLADFGQRDAERAQKEIAKAQEHYAAERSRIRGEMAAANNLIEDRLAAIEGGGRSSGPRSYDGPSPAEIQAAAQQRAEYNGLRNDLVTSLQGSYENASDSGFLNENSTSDPTLDALTNSQTPAEYAMADPSKFEPGQSLGDYPQAATLPIDGQNAAVPQGEVPADGNSPIEAGNAPSAENSASLGERAKPETQNTANPAGEGQPSQAPPQNQPAPSEQPPPSEQKPSPESAPSDTAVASQSKPEPTAAGPGAQQEAKDTPPTELAHNDQTAGASQEPASKTNSAVQEQPQEASRSNQSDVAPVESKNPAATEVASNNASKSPVDDNRPAESGFGSSPAATKPESTANNPPTQNTSSAEPRSDTTQANQRAESTADNSPKNDNNISPSQSAKLEAPARNESTSFKDLSPKEQTAVNRQTDEKFYKNNPDMAGQKIDPRTQPEKAQEWKDNRQEVMNQRAPQANSPEFKDLPAPSEQPPPSEQKPSPESAPSDTAVASQSKPEPMAPEPGAQQEAKDTPPTELAHNGQTAGASQESASKTNPAGEVQPQAASRSNQSDTAAAESKNPAATEVASNNTSKNPVDDNRPAESGFGSSPSATKPEGTANNPPTQNTSSAEPRSETAQANQRAESAADNSPKHDNNIPPSQSAKAEAPASNESTSFKDLTPKEQTAAVAQQAKQDEPFQPVQNPESSDRKSVSPPEQAAYDQLAKNDAEFNRRIKEETANPDSRIGQIQRGDWSGVGEDIRNGKMPENGYRPSPNEGAAQSPASQAAYDQLVKNDAEFNRRIKEEMANPDSRIGQIQRGDWSGVGEDIRNGKIPENGYRLPPAEGSAKPPSDQTPNRLETDTPYSSFAPREPVPSTSQNQPPESPGFFEGLDKKASNAINGAIDRAKNNVNQSIYDVKKSAADKWNSGLREGSPLWINVDPPNSKPSSATRNSSSSDGSDILNVVAGQINNIAKQGGRAFRVVAPTGSQAIEQVTDVNQALINNKGDLNAAARDYAIGLGASAAIGSAAYQNRNIPSKNTTEGPVILYKYQTPTAGVPVPGLSEKGEYMLWFPDRQKTEQAYWDVNEARLLSVMSKRSPIYDSHVDSMGNLIPTTGFLQNERLLLHNNGWKYLPSLRTWVPP